MAKFGTHASSAIWWPILQLMQVAPSGGQIWLTNASGILFSWRDNSSPRCYALGPLCLWQCFSNTLPLNAIAQTKSMHWNMLGVWNGSIAMHWKTSCFTAGGVSLHWTTESLPSSFVYCPRVKNCILLLLSFLSLAPQMWHSASSPKYKKKKKYKWEWQKIRSE